MAVAVPPRSLQERNTTSCTGWKYLLADIEGRQRYPNNDHGSHQDKKLEDGEKTSFSSAYCFAAFDMTLTKAKEQMQIGGIRRAYESLLS